MSDKKIEIKEKLKEYSDQVESVPILKKSSVAGSVKTAFV